VKQKKLATVIGAVGLVSVSLTFAVAHGQHNTPTDAQVEFAKGTSDLLTNTLIAALVQEIGETTPANAEQGKLSISLVFDDNNPNIRLVGTLQPLEADNVPQDDFERDALAAALTGTPFARVERVHEQYYYRRSVPLSNFVPQCAMCHANFASLSSTTWVGAVMERVPIATDK
jgi:hypothetical protein